MDYPDLRRRATLDLPVRALRPTRSAHRETRTPPYQVGEWRKLIRTHGKVRTRADSHRFTSK